MKLRFLRVTESEVPGYPFFEGQTIEVSALTPAMQRWLKPDDAGLVRAELLREESEPELATVGSGERAVTRKAKRRGA
jgi:hypothetical protein